MGVDGLWVLGVEEIEEGEAFGVSGRVNRAKGFVPGSGGCAAVPRRARI